MSRNYDVVLYGATSFVGQIATRYLMQRPDLSFTWAMAGRSEDKLKRVVEEQSAKTTVINEPDIIIADSENEASLAEMCERATVVISTVGPYALYGEPLIKACIAAKTDYLDLTGEPQWIKRMLDKYQDEAQSAGVRLVNCCGFDSIPSDLGVYFLQQHVQQKYGEPAQRVAMRVHRIKGGASGGTVASMLNLVDEVKADPALRKVIGNPYALCQKDHGYKAYQPNLNTARYDQETRHWMAPFIMAAINTRIVHRSNSLLNSSYGDRFVYDEAMLTGKGLGGMGRGMAMAVGLGGFMLGAAVGPIRSWMENSMLPKPGEGPSEKEQEKGMYDIRFYGHTESGKRCVAKVRGDRDPGYGSTAKMLCEAALCLALNEGVKEHATGFLTPASAFKGLLFEPLHKYAGLTFEIDD